MQKVAVILLCIFQTLTVSRPLCQTIAGNRTQSVLRYAVFTSDTDVDFAFYRQNYRPIKLRKNQLDIAKSIIKRVSDSLNYLNTSTNVNTGIVDTLKYVFQIVSAISKKGQVYLWVNAMCDPGKNWRSRLLIVEDGGSCYYRFKINLKTKQYFNIEINSND